MIQQRSWRLPLTFLALWPAVAGAQILPSVSLPSTREFQLRSAVTARDYRLFVSLPEGYDSDTAVRYPVLYVLDGNDFFPVATHAHRLLRIFNEVPNIIIVGVGYDARFFMDTFVPRWADYTPSRDEGADTRYARQFLADRPKQVLKSGDGMEFLRLLREQVIPVIDGQLRTTSDRGLLGHSFGGLFALYALFEQPELFTRYSICSPSLWWNQREPLTREAAYAARHKSLPARVFLSVGADEGTDLFKTFVATIRGRGYEQLQLTSHIFEGETQASVVPAALSRSLRVLCPVTAKP
jgi:predicted alpha/beta superfamily hydrolase